MRWETQLAAVRLNTQPVARPRFEARSPVLTGDIARTSSLDQAPTVVAVFPSISGLRHNWRQWNFGALNRRKGSERSTLDNTTNISFFKREPPRPSNPSFCTTNTEGSNFYPIG